MLTFKKVILYTGRGGLATFREEEVVLTEGTPQAALSSVFSSGGYQLRHSPIGFRSDWHCTPRAQWVFVLGGEMERVRLPWNGGFFGSYDPSQWRDGVGQRRVRVAPGMVAIQILAQMHMPVGIEVAAGA